MLCWATDTKSVNCKQNVACAGAELGVSQLVRGRWWSVCSVVRVVWSAIWPKPWVMGRALHYAWATTFSEGFRAFALGHAGVWGPCSAVAVAPTVVDMYGVVSRAVWSFRVGSRWNIDSGVPSTARERPSTQSCLLA